MTKILVAFLLFATSASASFTAELNHEVRVFDHKIVLRHIDPEFAWLFTMTLAKQPLSNSDVLVIIDSPGGQTDLGDEMYKVLRVFANGHKLVCLGQHQVASMAFNIMSMCDERYADPSTKFMMHDPYRLIEAERAITKPKPVKGKKKKKPVVQYLLPVTLQDAREIVRDLEPTAFKYRETNALALKLRRSQIDYLCDHGDTDFTVPQLLQNGYLQGVGKIIR